MTTNLGWECPVCHHGNNPVALGCTWCEKRGGYASPPPPIPPQIGKYLAGNESDMADYSADPGGYANPDHHHKTSEEMKQEAYAKKLAAEAFGSRCTSRGACCNPSRANSA